MKKFFILILVITAGTFIFATGNDKKKPTPPKGTVIINAKDSTVTYRHSDSALASTMIPAGYKAVEKPR